MESFSGVWNTRELGVSGEVNLDTIKQLVRSEQRESAKVLVLNAINVVDHGDGVFQVLVSGFPNIDWTWEGASAFRSVDFESKEPEPDTRQWKADVIGIEPDESSLYVTTSADSAYSPHRGKFIVKPFDFLQALADILERISGTSAEKDFKSGLSNTQYLGSSKLPTHASVSAVPQEFWDSSCAALWGPPGTGKTHTIGKLVAEVSEKDERILVVSTTNKATDEVAISIGKNLNIHKINLEKCVRLGVGANWTTFEKRDLDGLLKGGEAEIRRQISRSRVEHDRETDPVKKAKIQKYLGELQKALNDIHEVFCKREKNIIVTTAYYAMRRLTSDDVYPNILHGKAPFTTVILDEAGLLSTIVAASLSLLASHRVIFVGDPKQLAPISKISRVLTADKARWLSSSALSMLDVKDADKPNVHLLSEQYRMAPEIAKVVSSYQYEGRLTTATTVLNRQDLRSFDKQDHSRCIWYVLDDDAGDTASGSRATRGPGNRSWIRGRTKPVIDKLMNYFDYFSTGEGLFITPFAAQAREINKFLIESDYANWRASTVHAQQGAEAEWVIFDTVHASSTGWPFDEWKRLVNVGLSRAREQIVLIASRSEMSEPYMSALAEYFERGIIFNRQWKESTLVVKHLESQPARNDPNTIGHQIEKRKVMLPVLSGEQQRLVDIDMDGKARIVRGVAGSGKTYVLSNWLVKVLASDRFPSDGRIWVLYANKSLLDLIEKSVREAWSTAFPNLAFRESNVVFIHLQKLLNTLSKEVGFYVTGEIRFDYDEIAKNVLASPNVEKLESRCDALFIDEAQDFGHSALELCFRLVKPYEKGSKAKPAMVFYDNAQDVYSRETPTWSDLGLDVRGRSTVMKESFRSTKQINEFAANVLFRLSEASTSPDYRELLASGLLEKYDVNGKDWWRVNYNQVVGPYPSFRKYENRDAELDGLIWQLKIWILEEGICPGDIKVLCNNKAILKKTTERLRSSLKEYGVDVVSQTSEKFINKENTIVLSTAHSFKGYEAEAVAVPATEKFSTKDGLVLSSALYVAMTRARSLLHLSCTLPKKDGVELNIVNALTETDRLIRGIAPKAHEFLIGSEAEEEQYSYIEPKYIEMVSELRKQYSLKFEPLYRMDGSVLADPVVWYEHGGKRVAGFEFPLDTALKYDLEDENVEIFEIQ